ncbi:MAG: hypothetical protein H8E34_04085 [Bacteroidetes bacterium]|nr:hypothetical protein [Bacteroidota bacterium]MBL6943214.1 hypothetical protein [Bacteroidales bacterium]
MKKLILNLILSLFVLSLPGCKQDISPSPMKFKAYEHNPIINPGAPGSWDELSPSVPNIVWSDSIFYLFYMGWNTSGRIAIGLASSDDGFHFTKFEGNPIISPDSKGFDAFAVAAPIVMKDYSLWIMYYNALETADYAPGPSITMASATQPTGPWSKKETAVLTSGSKGEWDAGFVIASSVIKLENNSYIMYYTGGKDFFELKDFNIGMATSKDGEHWKKYNDPATKVHPYAESDPVFMAGKAGDWDGSYVWMPKVARFSEGYNMYYTGIKVSKKKVYGATGYAFSKDGIRWERYTGNPVYNVEDDPCINSPADEAIIENPSFYYMDTLCFMFYSYGTEGQGIGLATAKVPVGYK